MTWAQASPPPPAAESSAVDAFLKANTVKSENVVNGSLFFRDFHKGQVPSLEQFKKLKLADTRFKMATSSDLASIKGELGTYVKSADADTRYLKVSDPVVRGDGSVFSESKLIPAVPGRLPVMVVPGLLTVEAENGKPRFVYVTNQTAGPLTHTRCGEGLNESKAGALQPGKSFHCQITDEPVTIQLFGEGANPTAVTMTVSAIGNLGESGQYTVQILVGN